MRDKPDPDGEEHRAYDDIPQIGFPQGYCRPCLHMGRRRARHCVRAHGPSGSGGHASAKIGDVQPGMASLRTMGRHANCHAIVVP